MLINKATAELVRTRWRTTSAQKSAKAIIQDLGRGKLPNLIEFFESINGRLDLRGLPLGNGSIKNCNLEDVDFSYADFENAWIENSCFKNAYFSKTNFAGLAEHGNEFLNTTFVKAKFDMASLGYKNSKYLECSFDGCSLIKTSFIQAEFERCTFSDCKFKETDFGVSSLEQVKFTGNVHDVWFRGDYASESDLKAFGPYKKNPMAEVDFRGADLAWLALTGGVKLDRVILPENEFVFYMDRLPEVLPLARMLVNEKLKGQQLEAAASFFRIASQLYLGRQNEAIFTLKDYEDKDMPPSGLNAIKDCMYEAREGLVN